MNTVTITLRNGGTSAVDASIVETSDPARFTTGPPPGIIPIGGTASLDIYFDEAALPGLHEEFLIIRAGNLVIPLTASTEPYMIEGSLGSGCEVRMVSDDGGVWFEFGFLAPFLLLGTAADGWTDPEGHLLCRMERSPDLVNWDFQMIEAGSSPEAVGDDWMYWARSAVPRVWKYVTIDVSLTSNRHAKSITALQLFGSTISLPGYPYAMPADITTLRDDLIAAGYTGTTVSTVSQALIVEAHNYANDGRVALPVTLSGSNVTAVKTPAGSTISLPSYPYAIPAQVTNLQAALVSAGYPYASVRAYGDEWTIFIPDRATTLDNRLLGAAISPADPYTYQGMFGTGTDSGASVSGTSGNVRATSGLAPLAEADKQFGRLGMSRGPNYKYE